MQCNIGWDIDPALPSPQKTEPSLPEKEFQIVQEMFEAVSSIDQMENPRAIIGAEPQM
ncbi:hypothetical protein L1049_014998 [Liquidambar formosana]|uniref:Uncharacterized protein n=1 Tax=Liquidambar formosana TaxID=63359 RepID=A0AAP0X5T7_LIQFO